MVSRDITRESVRPTAATSSQLSSQVNARWIRTGTTAQRNLIHNSRLRMVSRRESFVPQESGEAVFVRPAENRQVQLPT